MKKSIITIIIMIILAGIASAEVFGVKSSNLRTYTLMEIPTEHDTFYIISVHNRDYYYDDVKYYMFHTMELAKDNYSKVWAYINDDVKDKDLIARRNLLTVIDEDFQYLKRDNGSSGYVRITIIGVN